MGLRSVAPSFFLSYCARFSDFRRKRLGKINLMIIIRRVFLPASTILVFLVAGWILVGIRNGSHDDIYFGLFVYNNKISIYDLTIWVAAGQRRFSHFLNVPVTILSLRLMRMGFIGDVAVLAQLSIILGGLGFLIRRVLGGIAACGWLMTVVGGYALHWYFTPPISYPLFGLFSPMMLVISLLSLVRYCDRGGAAWLTLSVTSSALGFVWPEYNFILFPLATGVVVFGLWDGWRIRIRNGLPFLMAWMATIIAYLTYRWVMPVWPDQQNIGFDVGAWLDAVLILLEKGLLPFAMVAGVSLVVPEVPGVPAIPSTINFAVLWAVIGAHRIGFALVFVSFMTAFLCVFRSVRPHRHGYWLLLTAGAILMVLPVSVLALSSLYQESLSLGYIQGGVATSDAQVGFLTCVFATAVLVSLRWRLVLVHAGVAGIIGLICTFTLAYNLLNRDAIAVNQQRWTAFALLVDALPDGASVSAPTFWQRAGVTNIPGGLPFGMGNYWSEFALVELGKRIEVAGPDEAGKPNGARAVYGVRPDGEPLVLLSDSTGSRLLSFTPQPVDSRLTGGGSWNCAAYCQLSVTTVMDDAVVGQIMSGTPGTPQSLASWLLLPRSGAFGSR